MELLAKLDKDSILAEKIFQEIFEQEERVRKGWFPKNPNRVYSWDNESNKTE